MNMSQPSLFRTVPDRDYLHVFNEGVIDGQKVVDLLNYRKADVSTATNIPISSIRYEPQKMPLKLKEQLTEWATALNLVYGFFKNKDKTMLWFSIPNPLLGDIAPRDMIRVGRFKKLLNFIQTAIVENPK